METMGKILEFYQTPQINNFCSEKSNVPKVIGLVNDQDNVQFYIISLAQTHYNTLSLFHYLLMFYNYLRKLSIPYIFLVISLLIIYLTCILSKHG